MSVRGVAQVFRILDKNKNRKIDAGELENGLRQMGINLNEEQVSVLVKHFDRDNSGQIDLSEFLTAIRVSIYSFIILSNFIFSFFRVN